MEYTVKLSSKDAVIAALPNVYLHFAHHDYAVVWNAEKKTQDVVRGVNVFYGGMGEGSQFDTWQDAIHTSLYDAFQVYDELKDGDIFIVKYRNKTARFVCDGVHVIPQ